MIQLEGEFRDARARSSSDVQGEIVVGLLNNMPDPALEATERQFSTLIAAAAGPLPVRLRLSSLPEVPRGAAAREHIGSCYVPLDELLAERPDALIVTGTEPRAPALEEEPYFERLIGVLGWCETHTASSIWSCLAAHAAAQASYGVRRRRLPQKRFGVFAHRMQGRHPLLEGVRAPLLTPHSRWNELPADALEAAGLTVLSFSQETGADLFVSTRRSLLVCFQGHPEYEPATLLKEYRRDVGRYLRGEQPVWPALPHGYFNPEALSLLEAFRRRAAAVREPQLLDEFPMAPLAASLEAPWRSGAVGIYRNWLNYVANKKLDLRNSVATGV